jgi:NAD(P)H-dependent FMN reductase
MLPVSRVLVPPDGVGLPAPRTPHDCEESSTVLTLKIIIGSTRDGRASDLVAPWLIERAKAHGAFTVDVLDLRDWRLPLFAETFATIGDIADPTYSEPIVKRWNQTVKEGDAFLFLTPEYNHSVPGVLKNAIDNVFVSYGFRNKPSAFAAYSAGIAGGVRAIEHLAHIMIEAESVPLRNSVIVPQVQNAFDGTEPRNPLADAGVQIVLDDLAWWGEALQKARAGGELIPGNFRLRAAQQATAAS